MNLDPFSKNGLSGLGPAGKSKSPSETIFVKSKTGSAGRRSAPASGAEAQDALDMSSPEPAEEPEKKRAAVVLRNPKWEAEKVGFNEEAKISVELELPPEHAHKTKVTFELFANTPKGPERISQGEGNADGGKAIGSVPVYIPTYKDEDGNRMQKVEYYFNSKHSESETLDGSKAPKRVDEMAERLLQCHILPDITFGTGKCFLQPKQATVLKALCGEIKTWQKKDPEGKLAVFGHADAVGKEDPNKTLSERRAKSVHAFLMKDAKAWEATYKDEKWGLAPIQDMLRHLGHDPGASDGQDGPKTQAAVKGFQTEKGMTADGVVSDGVREALFKAMMADCNTLELKAKDFDDINGGPTAGCSEFNLVEKVAGASQVNRRVTVLHLKSNKNFPITYPCAKGDVGPCRKQVGRKGERRTAGFGCGFYDQMVVEQKGRGSDTPTKVKFIGITDAEIKQYVNLDPEAGKPEHGMERLIEVEVEGMGDGAEVYWTLTAGPDNSKRTDPKTGLKANKKDEPKPFENKMATLVSDGKASIVVACGVGGGDEFTVEGGAAKGKMDVKVKIVTWRKLEYETIQPLADGAGRLTDYTVFTPDKKPGLPSDSKTYLDKVLGEGFVEFKEIGKSEFTLSDLPENGKFNVLDAAYVGKSNGSKFLVATPDQLEDILDVKAKQRSNKRAVTMIWCDYLAEMEAWHQKFIGIFKSDIFTPEFSVFEKTVGTSSKGIIGSFAITSLKWSVSHWFDSSGSENDQWKPILKSNDPGSMYKTEGGTFTSEEDIKAHVHFEGINQLRFNFPKTKDGYPGKILKCNSSGEFSDKGQVLGVSFEIKGVACSTNTNGQAIDGIIWMNTFAGRVQPVGMAGVIAHELGHNMGQAYGDKNADDYFGRPNSKPIPGIPFPKPIPDGNVYGNHGHQGTHCATGVRDKAQKDFTDEKSTAFQEHECIMFGSADMKDSKEYHFCTECLSYIRAENLNDIHRSWNT